MKIYTCSCFDSTGDSQVNSSYLSQENLIFKAPVNEGKIYIREQKGIYQRVRRILGFALMAHFILIPFIQYKGSQAVLIDLKSQQLHLFSFTLYPQDLTIVSLILIFSAFALFYVTKFYGRVWCGFSCPQTIWMLLFNWVERRIEGSHNQSRSLDQQKLSPLKLVKKSFKHAVWLTISLLTALVFISYFVPVRNLYVSFFTFGASSLVVSWVLFFALCTYINAGWIREKMCQHMCPYSRFQSAMFDESTKLVSYDQARGENRGKRKRSQMKPESMGDCVDCNLCVQVCPVGIDIREGLQYECINCGLCVDACDATMNQFYYAPGLISFTNQTTDASSDIQPKKQSKKRHIGYGSIMAITLAAIVLWGNTWQSFDVNILRDRQALYRVNQDGNIENTYVLKIRNKTQQIQSYTIDILGLDEGQLIGKRTIEVLPNELSTISLAVENQGAPINFRQDIAFSVTNVADANTINKKTSFYGERF